MIYLTMTPHVEFIRVYDQPDGYEKRLPYIGIVAITHLTDTTAWVHCALSSGPRLTRAIRAQALEALRARGKTKLLVERHGQIKTIDLPVAAAQITE